MATVRWVLVVDDDDGIRDALVDTLESEHYAVRSAADGREALQILNEDSTSPCVMLLDLMMPELSGWQVLEALKQEGRLYEHPIVVLSAAKDAQASLPPGIAFLAKPFDLDEVLDKVAAGCAMPLAAH